MNSQPFDSTRQVEYLAELVNARTEVAGMSSRSASRRGQFTARYQSTAMCSSAEYDSLESAKAAIAQLPPNTVTEVQAHRGTSGRWLGRWQCRRGDAGEHLPKQASRPVPVLPRPYLGDLACRTAATSPPHRMPVVASDWGLRRAGFRGGSSPQQAGSYTRRVFRVRHRHRLLWRGR